MKKYRNVKIKIESNDRVRGFEILLHNGFIQGIGKDMYIVPEDVLDKLKEQNIKFEILEE